MFKKRKALKEQEQRIIEQMDLLDPRSKDYAVLCDRLEALQNSKPDKGGGLTAWIPVLVAVITGGFSVYNVRHITKVEETEIVPNKAFPFIKKP